MTYFVHGTHGHRLTAEGRTEVRPYGWFFTLPCPSRLIFSSSCPSLWGVTDLKFSAASAVGSAGGAAVDGAAAAAGGIALGSGHLVHMAAQE